MRTCTTPGTFTMTDTHTRTIRICIQAMGTTTMSTAVITCTAMIIHAATRTVMGMTTATIIGTVV